MATVSLYNLSTVSVNITCVYIYQTMYISNIMSLDLYILSIFLYIRVSTMDKLTHIKDCMQYCA